MSAGDTVTVWIPVYKTTLALEELMSLWQTAQMLSGRYRCVIKGKRSHRAFLNRLARRIDCNVEVSLMPDRVFASVGSYCDLLLSPKFYGLFDTSHVLIAQLDTWILKDCVDNFLAFDYVAPRFYAFPRQASIASTRCIGVGVGGLSLRQCLAHQAALVKGLSGYEANFGRVRTESFSRRGRASIRVRQLAARAINLLSPFPSAAPGLTALGCNEDWVLGIFCHNRMKVASRTDALRFGIDGYVAEQLKELSPAWPFGFHGWYRDQICFADSLPLMNATLCTGWAAFLRSFEYRFREENPDQLFASIAKGIRTRTVGSV